MQKSKYNRTHIGRKMKDVTRGRDRHQNNIKRGVRNMEERIVGSISRKVPKQDYS